MELAWLFVLFTWRFYCSFNIEQLFLIMRWLYWWWKLHWSSYQRYLFCKNFLKLQVHLFFGCFGVCICCIDSVTTVTFHLKSDSHLPKKLHYFLHWKPFKTDGKCFLFCLKSSFHSQDISVFVATFWSCRENGLIRKIRLLQNSWRHNLVYKQLQYTYCLISHKVKVTRQWNLVN